MNPDNDHQLEVLIGRELKQLPEIPAPRTLLPRVLAAIARRAALPWYRRAWQTWPRFLQILSLTVLAAMFGVLFIAAANIVQMATVSAPAQDARHWFSSLEVFCNALGVLLHAIVLAGQHLGPAVIALCVFAGVAAYASCVGLGTAFLRLAAVQK